MSARPQLPCCPLSAIPRDLRTFVHYGPSPPQSPCPEVTTGGCDFLQRARHQCSVATVHSGLGHPPSPSTPRCVPLSTLGATSHQKLLGMWPWPGLAQLSWVRPAGSWAAHSYSTPMHGFASSWVRSKTRLCQNWLLTYIQAVTSMSPHQ